MICQSNHIIDCYFYCSLKKYNYCSYEKDETKKESETLPNNIQCTC